LRKGDEHKTKGEREKDKQGRKKLPKGANVYRAAEIQNCSASRKTHVRGVFYDPEEGLGERRRRGRPAPLGERGKKRRKQKSDKEKTAAVMKPIKFSLNAQR